MALPRIRQRADGLGFAWDAPDGAPADLLDILRLPDAEPQRWLPTHLEALDDVLIEVASRFGDVLGGGRRPTPQESGPLNLAYRSIDRLTWEYVQAAEAMAAQAPAGVGAAGQPSATDPRAGQIAGTGALMSISARGVLGLMGPTPFEGELDDPSLGMVAGHARMVVVDSDRPWLGARWLIETIDGRRLPAGLSMLLHDGSGVDKDATLREHREALAAVSESVRNRFAGDPVAASGALDWLLFDWLLAHREDAQGGAVVFAAAAKGDADLVLRAAATSVGLRSRFDPGVIARVDVDSDQSTLPG